MRHLHLACQDCQQYFITMFGRPNCIDSHFCLQNIDQLKREASNARVSKGEFTEHICLARGFAMHGWENRRQHLSTYGNPKGGDVMMMSCCAAISQASEVSGRVIISIVFILIASEQPSPSAHKHASINSHVSGFNLPTMPPRHNT